MARIVAGCWLSLCCLALPAPLLPVVRQRCKQHSSRALESRLEKILDSGDASRGFWGVEVAELPSGKILFCHEAQRLFHPASNMKLFTTAVALEGLGAGFAFRTTVESDTPPDAQGRLQTLYLVGRGDPSFCEDALPNPAGPGQTNSRPCSSLLLMAQQLKGRGITEVAGPLVADDSYFVSQPYMHGWAAEDLLWGYGATVSALAVNSNALQLYTKPGAKPGDPAQVWLDPYGDSYQLESSLVTTGAGTERRVFAEREPDSMRLDVWGQIPADAGAIGERVAIAHPARLAGELFRRALQEAGIVVDGNLEVRSVTRRDAAKTATTEPASRVVLAEQDQPLRDLLRLTNKESRNFYAEMLLRTLARQMKHSGRLEDGLEVLNEFARQVGTLPGETVFADGSGLSRDDLVAPEAVVKLLMYMASRPEFETFFDTLPVAGADGTLAGRFKGTRLQGKLHAKTGTLEQVNALSGYMDLPSGKRIVFSILGNNHPLESSQGAATVDQIALAVYDQFARRKR